jgi:RNA polymerase sigma-70 factor (ECF subfamily)
MESSTSRSLDWLLMRAQAGSRSALGQLMASCRPWLQVQARRRLPRGLARKQDDSDLVQEVQYLAAAQFAEFQGRSPGEFRAWLTGILARRVFRALRFWGEQRRDRKREEPICPARGGPEEPADSTASIPEQVSQEEECQRLNLAASWCRQDDRAVISLHLFEGRSHDEIAAEWGVAAATVRQRYCRAVRRVGAALRLLDLMTQQGLSSLQQDVIGLHRFQGADPGRIADWLQLPEELVARWIAGAKPLLTAIAKDEP